jgi:hypothetical protein
MAKYEVNYVCGHGSVVKKLYGPGEGRQEFLDWAKDNLLCQVCWVERLREQDAAAPAIAVFSATINPIEAIWTASGQLEAHKAPLEALGFGWRVGVPELTSFSPLFSLADRLSRSWAYVATYAPTSHLDMQSWAGRMELSLTNLGYKCEVAVKLIDAAMVEWAFGERKAREREKAEAERRLQEWLAVNPMPKPPDWYRGLLASYGGTARCNGRIYRHDHIYVNNTEHRLTPGQQEEFLAYQNKKDAWIETRAALDRAVVLQK